MSVGAVFLYAIVLPLRPPRGAIAPPGGSAPGLAERLLAHVSAVASTPHNVVHYDALETAARYIEAELESYGFATIADVYEADGRRVRNIEVVIEPADGCRGNPTYVVGAHYDSDEDSPGANDNASGVAALLEIARLLGPRAALSHRLRLVFYVNEEQPYAKSPLMGSWRHARSLAEAGEPVAGMIALETLGYFSDEPGTQAFPFPFNLIYPDVGDFVAFVGLPGSRRFLQRLVRAFRVHAPLPSIGGIVPGFIETADFSDHWSYGQFGFPAVMLTDTAPFRNPYYHQPDDLPESVDYDSLARITLGIEQVLRHLAR